MESNVFRKKTLDRISSPEQLSDYLQVSNPGIWIIMSAVVLLLLGIIAWSAVGVLESVVAAKAFVKDGEAKIVIISEGSKEINTGMSIRVASEEYLISKVVTDEYGRSIAIANVSLPDGDYDAEIVTQQIHPIEFLLEGGDSFG